MSRSFSYDRYDNHRRRPASATRNNTLGYWVPLVITVTLAAGGLAAWVWSTRDDHESTDHGGVTSDDENLSYGEEARAARERYGRDPRHPASEGLSEGVVRDDEYVSGGRNGSDQTFLGGMQRGAQEVFKRTPSPQQAYDSAKKWGAAGIAAAGAAAAGALSAIREESTHSRDGRHESRRADEYFSDQERWSEEADSKRVVTHADQSRGAVSTNVTAFSDSLRGGSQQHTGGRRKIVAIVLSSEAMLDQLQDEDGKYHSEHASLLSHLPQINPNTTSLQILIYNPNPSRGAPKAPSSIGSSYAAINTPAQTPGEELQQIDPQPYSSAQNTPALSARSSGGDFFDLLYKQAVRIVEDPVNVLTFETQQGWVHMCKHMSPDLVYVVDSLSGANGQNIEAVKGWVGQVVVAVGGGGSGLGGLIDTEDEMSDVKGKERVSSRSWWMDSNMIGLGKGVEIVDGNRFSDDWERRVSGRE